MCRLMVHEECLMYDNCKQYDCGGIQQHKRFVNESSNTDANEEVTAHQQVPHCQTVSEKSRQHFQ